MTFIAARSVGGRGSLNRKLPRRWRSEPQRIAQLAGFTQAATGGSAVAIASAGFRVRERNAKPQPLEMPEFLRAMTNGSPGKTRLTWQGLDGAVTYLVEMSTSPYGDGEWTQVATPTKSSCEVDGAEPASPAGSESPA